MEDPIDAIEWVNGDTLTANAYNPNRVFDDELRLLEFSILRTGWVQPILTGDNEIIDGFHRWWLTMNSKPLQKRYGGTCPIVRLTLPPAERMLLTIRINRAKGSHIAIKLADIIRALIDEHGVDEKTIAEGIGAPLAEIRLLYQNDLWKRLDLSAHEYSKAWVPAPRLR